MIMKKSIYIAIISAITVFCIIWGSWYHISGFAENLKEKFHMNFSSDKNDPIVNKSESNIILENFDRIEADIKVGDFKIVKGDSFKYSYSANRAWLIPEIKITKGTLSIKQSGKSKTNVGSNNASVTITVPEDTIFSDLDIDVNVGEVNLSDFFADKINVDVNVGEINLKNVDFTKGEFEVDVGDLQVNGVKDPSSYSLDIKCSIGDTNAFGNSGKKIKTDVSDKKYINADIDIGSCELTE